MEFSLSSVAQSQKFFCDVKSDMYDAVNDLASSSGWMRLTGPIIAAGAALIDLAARVATIGETSVKGLANIFGSPFFKKCHFFKGLKQLSVQLPLHVTALVFSPIKFVFNGFATTLGMAVSPEGYSRYKSKSYVEKSGEFEALIFNKSVKVQLPPDPFFCGRAYSEIPSPDCNSFKYLMYS